MKFPPEYLNTAKEFYSIFPIPSIIILATHSEDLEQGNIMRILAVVTRKGNMTIFIYDVSHSGDNKNENNNIF